MKRGQKGFGAVEGLLILILISILGFTGYYVYHTRNNANSTYDNSSNTSITTSANHQSKTLSGAVEQTQKVYDAWNKEIIQGQKLNDSSSWAQNPDNTTAASDLQLINNNKKLFTPAFVTKANNYRATNVTPPGFGLLGCQSGIAYYHNDSLKVTGDKVAGDTAQATVTYDQGRQGTTTVTVLVSLKYANGAWAVDSIDLSNC
jgi:hypothetical protein